MQHIRQLRGATLAITLAATLLVLLVACSSRTPATVETPAAEPTSAVEEATAAVEAPIAEPAGDQATLVVQLNDQAALVRKVDFTAPISGLALLEQSGLEVATSEFDWGTAVCSIEGVGCPADDCFCNDNIFWGYLAWQDNAWAGYPVGPAQSVISATGAIEGWQWGTGATPPIAAPRAEAAHAALNWLHGQLLTTEDGSVAGVDMLLSVAANQEDATQWGIAADAPSLLDRVLEQGADYSQGGASEAGKLAVALSGAEACWPAGAMRPSDYYSPTLGALHSDAGPLSWAILGTLALDEPTPVDSIDYLLTLALPEGGWEWSPGWGRDTNSTALALQALIAAGVPITESAIVSAQSYLESAQSDEGGYSYDPNASWGNVADANSTAYVLQAMAALGVDAPTEAIDFLLALQGDEGALGWQTAQPATNLSSTQQAIPALLGQAYPLRRVALPACE
jgi:hypothetical protein